MRGLRGRGPGVNHLLRWASETHTCIQRAPPISRGIKNTRAERRGLREQQRQRDGKRGKRGEKMVGEQMGQRGCAGRWACMMQRSEKEFKERKVDSLKVITCHKLPGQQA